MSTWGKVAEGARLVALAALKQASQEATVATSRAANHGVDLTSKVRVSSTEIFHILSQQLNSAYDVHAGAAGGEPTPPPRRRDGPNPYESQLRKPNTSETKINGTSSSTAKEKPQPDPYLFHAQLPSDGGTPSSSDENRTTITTSQQQQQHEPAQDFEKSISNDNEINIPQVPSDEEAQQFSRLQEGRAIPATRFGRALGFAQLGAGLVFGTAGEAASRLIGGGSTGNVVTNDKNADRVAATLCRMRGAALKMGQMLSIQDESLLPPALTRALKQVRQGADAMPNYQFVKQMESQLGTNWRDKFETFDDQPFAAASIGQVHRATIKDEAGNIQNVVVKVQYPGVADSIESDLRNLTMLVKMTGLAPKGLFIENVIRVGRDELKVECNYINEMANQRKFKELVESDPILVENGFVVPEVVERLTTEQVITSGYSSGGTIDKVSNMDQSERDRIGRTILYLTMRELFVWRLMQTDPNWGNFLYDVKSRQTTLIDFGATRSYSKEFVDGYLRIVWASANRDEETLFDQSHRMGFLTGEENNAMIHAHKMSGFTVGEPFWTNDPFDFKGSNISTRMGEHTSVFLKHRLT
jgi:aarF domain-containing kinase